MVFIISRDDKKELKWPSNLQQNNEKKAGGVLLYASNCQNKGVTKESANKHTVSFQAHDTTLLASGG